MGEYDRSKEIYDEVILNAQKNGIKNADLHHDYALLLSNGLKKYKEASSHYLKSIEYCKDDNNKRANFCGNYAGLLRITKEFDKSERYFKKALELNPEDIHHLSNYADLLREVGKYKEAKIKFNHAVSIIELAEIQKGNKRKKRSALTPTPSSSSNGFGSSHKKGRRGSGKKRASAIYKRNSALDNKITRAAVMESNAFTKKNVGKTYSNYGLLLFSMKSYDESSKLYRKSIEIDEDNQIRHYNYARLLYDTQQWNLAINHLEIALELSSNQHAASYWLYGRICMEMQDFEKATLYLKNAIDLQRNNPLYRCDYILSLLEYKKYTEAVSEMQNYKKLKVHYSYFDLIYTYFIAKIRRQTDDANKNFKILMEHCPDDHPTSINSKFIYYYYYAWFLQYMMKDFEQAIKYYNLIIDELRPKHALSAYHYSVCIISKWIEINNKQRQENLKNNEVIEEVDLNDDEPSTRSRSETSEYSEEQIREYKHASRLIKKAFELNPLIPIIKQHYRDLLQKCHKVLGDLSDEASYVEDKEQGFTIVITTNDDEKKEDK